MHFYYCEAAASDHNWLHEWYLGAIHASLEAVDAGQPTPDWEDITSDHVDALQGRWALEKDFTALIDAYRKATPSERVTAKEAIAQQNSISDACDGATCLRASDLAEPIAAASVALGDRLFNLLSELGIRKLHYAEIWKHLKDNVCPFCALIELDDPSLKSEDLDHYLLRRVYPFAAANLRNLAPMCKKCNMNYKGEKDALSNPGVHRHYPYGSGESGRIRLFGSAFFANGDDKPPVWNISLTPEEKGDEWDRIFEIKSRYQLNVLDRRYIAWLKEWADTLPQDFEKNDEGIYAALAKAASDWSARGLHDKAFLKAAFFSLVEQVLRVGDANSIQLFAVLEYQIDNREPADVTKNIAA